MGGIFGKSAVLVFGTVVTASLILDYIRHADPNFKRKLKCKRERERQLLENQTCLTDCSDVYAFNLLHDSQDKEAIILYEIGVAEELMERKLCDRAAHHFANAICVCDNPGNMLRALRKTLPNSTFERLAGYVSSYDHHKFLKYPEFHTS